MKQLITISIATIIGILTSVAIIFAIYSHQEFERKVDERALAMWHTSNPEDYERAKVVARVMIQNGE